MTIVDLNLTCADSLGGEKRLRLILNPLVI